MHDHTHTNLYFNQYEAKTIIVTFCIATCMIHTYVKPICLFSNEQTAKMLN